MSALAAWSSDPLRLHHEAVRGASLSASELCCGLDPRLSACRRAAVRAVHTMLGSRLLGSIPRRGAAARAGGGAGCAAGRRGMGPARRVPRLTFD